MIIGQFFITDHAAIEIERRNIQIEYIKDCLLIPGEILPSEGNRVVYQKKYIFDKREFLLRVIIEPRDTPQRIITVYKTSKIEKYWRGK